MLRTKSALPHSVARWIGQVVASIGATLVASLVYSTLLKPVAAEAPRPELTSGGKFAVRAIAPAVAGLDTMPLPPASLRILQASTAPAEAPALVRRIAFDVASPVPAPDRPVRAVRSAHVPAKTEAHRSAGAQPASPAVVAAASSGERAAEPADQDGILQAVMPRLLPAVLPTVVSTARTAWTMTASAGASLVDRVVPQMP